MATIISTSTAPYIRGLRQSQNQNLKKKIKGEHMTRHDMIFDINYSFYVEKMTATLAGRIDRLISVLLMVLGCAAFSPFSGMFIFGVFIAALSAIQFIYQFGKLSGLSEEHAKKYLRLMTEESKYDDAELLTKLTKLQETDCNSWGLIVPAAFKRTCYKLGLDDDSAELGPMEKVFAWFAGDLPKRPKVIINDDQH
ncbi:TPA: hypothetical protein ACG1DO_003494 [Kluyvera ascorbata]